MEICKSEWAFIEKHLIGALKKAEKEGQPVLEMLQAVQNGKEIQVSIRETAGEERLFFSL